MIHELQCFGNEETTRIRYIKARLDEQLGLPRELLRRDAVVLLAPELEERRAPLHVALRSRTRAVLTCACGSARSPVGAAGVQAAESASTRSRREHLRDSMMNHQARNTATVSDAVSAG